MNPQPFDILNHLHFPRLKTPSVDGSDVLLMSNKFEKGKKVNNSYFKRRNETYSRYKLIE